MNLDDQIWTTQLSEENKRGPNYRSNPIPSSTCPQDCPGKLPQAVVGGRQFKHSSTGVCNRSPAEPCEAVEGDFDALCCANWKPSHKTKEIPKLLPQYTAVNSLALNPGCCPLQQTQVADNAKQLDGM